MSEERTPIPIPRVVFVIYPNHTMEKHHVCSC